MKYFGDFEKHQDILDNFQINAEAVSEAEVVFASYGTPPYEGDAFVLYERGGLLYEVNGGHCSCYGLEGQWEPEETTWEALAARPRLNSYGEHPEAAHIRLRELIAEHVPFPDAQALGEVR